MLSTSNPIKAGSSRDYYREMERGEYYTGNGQSPGQWFGPGAKALGLAGKVTSDVLSNLFEGRSPDGERNLVQNAGHPNRQMGWDHTFSAPKPMSTFYAVCPEYRDLCEQIQTAGVRVAASYLSDVAGKSRQGKGGKDRVDAKLVFAMFLETVSRALDPQIHTHALVLNVGVRADGTTGALWSRELFVEKMAAGAIYRAQLAFDLRRLLGVEIKARRVGFDIVGVPAELSREFSKRRQAIEAMLEEWKDDSAVAAKVATLVTRHAKRMLPIHELDARWQATASKHQWTAENARMLVGKTPWRQASAKELAEAVLSEASRLPDHLRNRKHVVRLAGRLAIELNADGAALRGLFETKLPEMLRTLNARKTSQPRQEQIRSQAKQHSEESVGMRHQMGSSPDRERPDSSAAKSKTEAKGEETWPDVVAVSEAVGKVQDANSKTQLDENPKAKPNRNVAPDARKPEQNTAKNQTYESPTADKAGNEQRRDESGQQKPAPGEEETERSRKAPVKRQSPDQDLKSIVEREISRVASDLTAVQTESSVNAPSTNLPAKEALQTKETTATKKQAPASALTQEQSRPTAPNTIKSEQSAAPKRRVRSVIHTRANLQDTLAEMRRRHGIEQQEQSGASQDRGGQAASQEVASEGLREGKPQTQPNTSATATERAKEHPEESPKGWKGTVERSDTGLPTVVRVRQSRLGHGGSDKLRHHDGKTELERKVTQAARTAGVLKPGMTATWSEKHSGVLVRSEEGLTLFRFTPAKRSESRPSRAKASGWSSFQKDYLVDLVKSPEFVAQAEAAHEFERKQSSGASGGKPKVSADGQARDEARIIREFRAAFQDRLEQMHHENRSADRVKRLAFWLGREAGLKPDVIERAIGDLVPKDGWTLFRVESRQLFPKAASLALRKLRTRRLVLFNPPRYWGKVRWTVNLLVCELRAQEKFLAPHSPGWSPFHNWRVPVLRITAEKANLPQHKPLPRQDAKRDASHKEAARKPKVADQEQRQTMDHGWL